MKTLITPITQITSHTGKNQTISYHKHLQTSTGTDNQERKEKPTNTRQLSCLNLPKNFDLLLINLPCPKPPTSVPQQEDWQLSQLPPHDCLLLINTVYHRDVLRGLPGCGVNVPEKWKERQAPGSGAKPPVKVVRPLRELTAFARLKTTPNYEDLVSHIWALMCTTYTTTKGSLN